MESPTGFVTGIGKGTSRLIGGVASGVVGSASNIVGTASGGVASVARGVALASGNDKFVKQSEDRRRELKASGGGVFAGFKAGGESVVSGFSSGITGLVTKPFEEGRKGGAVGFLKGVGQGLIGVAVKPVMGVTEGISTIAQGINQSVNSQVGTVHVRPKRAFYRRDPDVLDELILVPLNKFQADAQNFIEKRALKKNYSDQYIMAVSLGFSSDKLSPDDGIGLILSRNYVFFVSGKMKCLWMLPISGISYVELFKQNELFGIRFREYESTTISSSSLSDSLKASSSSLKSTSSSSSQHHLSIPRQVIFIDRRHAADAYDQFVLYRKFFGNPQRMEPSEEIFAKIGDIVSSRLPSPNSNNTVVGLFPGGNTTAGSPRIDQKRSDSMDGVFLLEPGESSSTIAVPIIQEPAGDRAAVIMMMQRQFSSQEGALLYKDYAFGTANTMRFDIERLNDEKLLRKYDLFFQRQFMRLPIPIPSEERHRYHRYLDEAVWKFIYEWNANHDFLMNPSRICCCLVINYSPSTITFNQLQLKEGLLLQVFGIGDTYDPTGKYIKAGGGAALVVGTSKRPSLVSLEHVKIVIDCTAFKSMVSTRENRSDCDPKAGYFPSYLEKTRTDWYAKYVISVS
jgi:hypothetical protein